MLAQGSGRIVNLASQAAVIGLDRHVAYCASKAAIVGMIQGIARNGRPGLPSTPSRPPLSRPPWAKRPGPATWVSRARLQIPAGRFAQPEEIAGLALYLLSDAAQMVTGANMVIDGGYSIRN